MKKKFILKIPLVMMFIISMVQFAFGQQSTNTVDYKVSYDLTSQMYTVWVVPNYVTPNPNNLGATEKGATAQVSLKVPSGFVISQITDVAGIWDKAPLKLGPNEQPIYGGQGLDPTKSYYVIGKAASETDYGQFILGTPVALFTFKGNGCSGPVEVITNTDPFVSVSDSQLSLNTAPSFYSRSGQPAGGNQNPLEQYRAPSAGSANCFDAISNTYNATAGTPAIQNILANDSFNGGIPTLASVNLSVTTQPINGTTTVNPDGTITYTPNAGFAGTDTYTYQICDKANPTVCDVATVSITVSCPVMAAPTASNPAAICSGNSAVLTGSCASGTLTWYSDAALTTTLASTTVSPSATTTYYAACLSGVCKSPATNVVVTVNPTPLAPTASNPAAICSGSSAALIANCTSGTLTWYSDAALTTTLVSATVSPSATTTYYAACLNGVCKSPATNVDVTVNPTPLAPTASNPAAICSGNSAVLTGSCASGTLTWFSDAALTTTLASATVSPSATTTYYAACLNGVCKSLATNVDVTVNPTPLAPTASNPAAICSGNSAVLTGSCASGTLTWYSDAALTTTLASTTVSPSATTTYHAACLNGVCKSPATNVIVTVNPTPLAPTASNPAAICSGNSAVLTGSCASGTLTWYSDAALTTTLASATVSPSATTTYYAACLNGVCKSPATNVIVTVNPTPLAPTASNPAAICSGSSAVLTGSCASGTLTWYSDAALTTTLASATVSPSVTTTYYAACLSGVCKSLATNVVITVNPTPLAPTASNPAAICSGSSATLIANCTSGTLTWYSDAALTTTLVSATVSPSATTTYYAACLNGVCKSPATNVDVTVNPTPLAPTASNPAAICSGNSAVLTGSCASGTLTWFSDAALTTTLASATVSPSATTTYYAACLNGVCKSLATNVIVTVNPTPLAPTASNPAAICSGNSAVLTGSCASGTLTWYSDVALTTTLASATVSPSVTTTYYAACLNGVCKSPATNVVVTVNPTPLAPTASNPAAICSGNSAVLTGSCASGTLTWYSDVALTTTLASATVSPSATTTYYAACLNGVCKSPATNVILTVNPTPLAPTASNPAAICSGSSAVLTGSCASGTLTWYSDVALTTTLASATVSPSVTTTYYAACLSGVCKSPATNVVVTIINCKIIYAYNDNNVTQVNTPVNGSVLTNDDINNAIAPLVVSTTPVLQPTHGSVVLNSNGTYTYTPAPNYTGNDSFKYRVCDASSPVVCDTATVFIDIVAPINPAANNQPIALDDIQSTPKNTPLTFNVLVNDKDPDVGQNLTSTVLTNPTHGTVTLNPDGTMTYTPTLGYVGDDSFTYQVCDNGSPVLCDQATIQIVVKDPTLITNFPPVAGDDLTTTPSGVSTNGNLLLNDKDPENTLLTINTTPITPPSNGTVVINPNGTYTYTPNPGFVGTDKFVYEVCDAGTPKECAQATVYLEMLVTKVSLLPKAYLQGSLFGVTGTNWMRDDLRVKGLLPSTSPYPGIGLSSITVTGSVAPSVFAVIGADAIVDWVFVELRDPNNNQQVLDSRSALIQRDGDIVDLDGVSALTFNSATPASYYVVVKHRNHLGVMSKNAIPLSTTTTTIDFRLASTPTFTFTTSVVDKAQVIVEQGVALWAGNALYDNKVIYQGTLNDVNTIYQQVINATGNLFVSSYFKLKGYYAGDINMNGEVIFQGTNNDVEFIYQNIIKNHPGNTLKQNYFIIKEQLP